MADETSRGIGVTDWRVRVGYGSWILCHAPLRITRWTAGAGAVTDTGQPDRDGGGNDRDGGKDDRANTEEHEASYAATDANHPGLRSRGGGDGLSSGDGDGDDGTAAETDGVSGARAVRHTASERMAPAALHDGSG
jgi:hypothetical protein